MIGGFSGHHFACLAFTLFIKSHIFVIKWKTLRPKLLLFHLPSQSLERKENTTGLVSSQKSE